MDVLNDNYDRWARAPIGLPIWRSDVIASCELRWSLNGYMRGLVDMEKKRAKLWSPPPSDLCAHAFCIAHDVGGPTWAKKSLSLLSSYGIADFPAWACAGKHSGYSVACASVLYDISVLSGLLRYVSTYFPSLMQDLCKVSLAPGSEIFFSPCRGQPFCSSVHSSG